MGIGDSNPADNGKKRIEDPIGGASSTVVTCSICLEQISIGGDRSTANLQCGHQFHLDCVGSAFNYISAMQCPNCRQLENGNWLFSSDLRLSSANEYNEYIDDFTDESYHVNYSDMFCPYRNRFSSLAYYGDPNLVPRNSDHSSLPQRYGQADFVSQNPEISEYLSTPVYPHNFGPFPMQNIHQHQHQHQHQHPQPPPPFSLWNSSIPMLSVARPNPDSFPVDDIAYRHHSMGSLSQYVNQHFNGNETLGSSANMRAPARPDGSNVPDITPMQIHSLVTRLRDLSVSPQYTEDRQHENNGGSYTSNVQSISTHDQMEQSQQQAFPSSENSGFYNRNTSHNHNSELNMTGNNNGQYQWEGDLLAPFPLLPVEGDFPYWDRLPLVRTETPTPTPPPSDYGSNLFTSFWSHNYNGSNATTPSSNQPPTSHLHHLH